MRTQVIKMESNVLTAFKRVMYALMVVVVAIAIPVLSYMELSYKTDAGQKEPVRTENFASKTVNGSAVSL